MATLIEWFAAHGTDFPWRCTRDRYAVLVAEVQLQSTQAARVVPYFEAWMARWPTACALAGAPLADVLAAWQGLGYPRRARNLHRAARQICASGWPADDRLSELPGVGPYTAAAIRCFADGAAVLPRDTNVARVLARRFPAGWPGTPEGAGWAVGQALMDLGREWCTARAPRCASGCPLRERVSGRRCRQRAGGDSAPPPPIAVCRVAAPAPGALLRELTAAGSVEIDRDAEAAATLVADGLARVAGAALVLPEDS